MMRHKDINYYKHGKNIWKKIEKFSKTWQDKKSLIIYFCVFFKLLSSKFNFWEGNWVLGTALIWIFFNMTIISRKSFYNSWGSSYTKLVILDIKFGFTYGERDLY